jgi:gliding motility-associated-like protein
VFSPNDDGENERFIIYGKGVKEIRTLQIFDRWGSMLWRADGLTAGDENAGWDGTSRGDPLNPAVFVWWAEIEFIDGLKEIYFGDVTIVR